MTHDGVALCSMIKWTSVQLSTYKRNGQSGPPFGDQMDLFTFDKDKDGRIVGQGQHADLIESSPAYHSDSTAAMGRRAARRGEKDCASARETSVVLPSRLASYKAGSPIWGSPVGQGTMNGQKRMLLFRFALAFLFFSFSLGRLVGLF